MRKMILVLVVLFAAIGLAACGGQPATPTEWKTKVAGGMYTNVVPTQLKQMRSSKDFFFVNVHIPYEGEIAQTDAFIPYDETEQDISKFPADKNAKIFLYCRSGRMSAIAAETLVKLGYTNIWNLDGGMISWETAGFPTIQYKK